MTEQSLTGNAYQRNSTRSQRKSSINSSRPEQKRQANDFLKYLSSEPSEMMDSKQLNEPTKTFELEQKHYMTCPQLYESYRTESCIEELKGDNCKILKYSKGRNEFLFGDVIEVEIPNVVKLTAWNNGDYKLIYNELVYFWHEEEKCLDKYCVTI